MAEIVLHFTQTQIGGIYKAPVGENVENPRLDATARQVGDRPLCVAGFSPGFVSGLAVFIRGFVRAVSYFRAAHLFLARLSRFCDPS